MYFKLPFYVFEKKTWRRKTVEIKWCFYSYQASTCSPSGFSVVNYTVLQPRVTTYDHIHFSQTLRNISVALYFAIYWRLVITDQIFDWLFVISNGSEDDQEN